MAHVRQQIREAVATMLDNIVGATADTVYQSRTTEISESVMPCLVVYSKREQSEIDSMTPPRGCYRELNVVVEGYAKATTNMDDTLDTIAEEVEQAIASDITLGGLCRDISIIETDINYDGKADKPAGVVRMTFRAQYRVLENNVGTAI